MSSISGSSTTGDTSTTTPSAPVPAAATATATSSSSASTSTGSTPTPAASAAPASAVESSASATTTPSVSSPSQQADNDNNDDNAPPIVETVATDSDSGEYEIVEETTTQGSASVNPDTASAESQNEEKTQDSPNNNSGSNGKGDEIFEEEILVDENGNEIFEEAIDDEEIIMEEETVDGETVDEETFEEEIVEDDDDDDVDEVTIHEEPLKDPDDEDRPPLNATSDVSTQNDEKDRTGVAQYDVEGNLLPVMSEDEDDHDDKVDPVVPVISDPGSTDDEIIVENQDLTVTDDEINEYMSSTAGSGVSSFVSPSPEVANRPDPSVYSDSAGPTISLSGTNTSVSQMTSSFTTSADPPPTQDAVATSASLFPPEETNWEAAFPEPFPEEASSTVNSHGGTSAQIASGSSGHFSANSQASQSRGAGSSKYHGGSPGRVGGSVGDVENQTSTTTFDHSLSNDERLSMLEIDEKLDTKFHQDYPPVGDNRKHQKQQPNYDQAPPTKDNDDCARKYFCPIPPKFLCLLLIGGVIAIAIIFGLNRRNTSGIVASQNPPPPSAPTPAPDTPAPTPNNQIPFDPLQDNCDDLAGLGNPHVIDQCECEGSIDVLSRELRRRYNTLLQSFIPSIYATYNEEITSCSARNQALLWLASGENVGFTLAELEERFALATLFIELGGKTWLQNDDWLSSDSVCTWFGIDCLDGVVTSINWNLNNLVGQISQEIGLLAELDSVSMASNSISGSIPSTLFALPFLRLVDLSSNMLTGPLPLEGGNGFSLEDLNVANNMLSGRLSRSLGNSNSLRSLILSSNKFVGLLPTTIFSLPQLQTLQVPDNELTGTIPQEIARATSLINLSLGPNLFSGTIPQAISELTNLERLVLSGRELRGFLPDSYGIRLTNLLELTITDTEMASKIPSDFGSLTRLSLLDLSRNQLRNVIPTNLGLLTNLRVLRLNNNILSGLIPRDFGNILTLTELSLNDNRLSGEIPSFPSLINLRSFTLDGNEIEGRVDPSLCILARDQVLDEFVVDCPFREGGTVQGVICPVPTCCSSCRAP